MAETSLARVVASWDERAGAYLDLSQRYPLFDVFADRLIGALPSDFAGVVVDVGAGAGLLGKRLLAQRPEARAVLAEPSSKMLALAVLETAHFRPRVRSLGASFDEIPTDVTFDAAL